MRQGDNPAHNGPVAVDKPSMQTSSWNPMFAYQLNESQLAVSTFEEESGKIQNYETQTVSNDTSKVKTIAKSGSAASRRWWFSRFNFLVLTAVVLVIILLVVIAVLVPRLQNRNDSLSGLPKEFTKGNFTIELRFMTSNLDETHKQLIIRAKERWETIILKELPSISELPANTEGCPGYADTSLSEAQTIDNLLIFVYIKDIDGIDGTLAVSGPCRFDQDLFPRTGVMTLDTQDVVKLASVNNLENVVKHEIGHVLGLGTAWDILRLLTPPTAVGPILYLGSQGKIGNEEIGREGKPIVESKGGAGTARGHWSEEVYKDELMTGWFFSNRTPLSRLTVRALLDHGYFADPDRADAFVAPRRRLMLRQTQEDDMEKPTFYGQDVLQGPFHRIQSIPRNLRQKDTKEAF